jgi:ABC-type dipeptide/oligopeptide/nickel transport system permease component
MRSFLYVQIYFKKARAPHTHPVRVITLVFFMLALSPGEPARVILGERANKEAVEKMNAELGLDKPMHVQYVIYLKKVVQLDFGKSIKTGQSVIDEIKARFPATIELAIFS